MEQQDLTQDRSRVRCCWAPRSPPTSLTPCECSAMLEGPGTLPACVGIFQTPRSDFFLSLSRGMLPPCQLLGGLQGRE